MGIPFSGEHNPSMRRPISSTIFKPGTWLLILYGAALWSRYLKASQQTICLPEAHQSLRGPHGWSCRLVSVHVVLGVAFSGFDFFAISQSARLHFLSIISKNKIRQLGDGPLVAAEALASSPHLVSIRSKSDT